MFYFEQIFRNALSSIGSTPVMPAILGAAGAILVATLLFNVYQAFARGGDTRTLAVGAIKYLVLGLIFLNYDRVFLSVDTMFNQVADFIAQVGPGGIDVLNRWGHDLVTFAQSSPDFARSFFALTIGTPTAVLSVVLLFTALVVFGVAYAIFCLFYAFYGSVLYVLGPLVLALYPALSTTPLARTYLTNLLVFHAWGLIYAVLGALMWAINLGSVGQVLSAGNAGGFFLGAGSMLLLSMASILFALCIALIPFIARRIVQGDVGSTMFAVVSAAVTAATIGASLAFNGLAALGQSSSGEATASSGGSGAGGASAAASARPSTGAAEQSSQAAPRPPDSEGSGGGSVAAAGAQPRSRPRGGRPGWRVYRPMDAMAMAAWGAGRGARKIASALRSDDTGDGQRG